MYLVTHLSLQHWLQPCDCTSGHKLRVARARRGARERACSTWPNHVRGSSQHRRLLLLLLLLTVSALFVLQLGQDSGCSPDRLIT